MASSISDQGANASDNGPGPHQIPERFVPIIGFPDGSALVIKSMYITKPNADLPRGEGDSESAPYDYDGLDFDGAVFTITPKIPAGP